jgi:hypothetical protein
VSAKRDAHIGLGHTSKVDINVEDRLEVKGSGKLLERVNSVNTKAAVSCMAAILRCTKPSSTAAVKLKPAIRCDW